MPLRYKVLPKAIAGHLSAHPQAYLPPHHPWINSSQITTFPSLPRGIHTTTRLQRPQDGNAKEEEHNKKTHYETLNLTPSATTAEIKRSFYKLSKTHHPDVNRDNPSASRHFMRISEAYTILSSPEKRTRYDRDVLGLHQQHHHQHRPTGSYSSTHAPAGGRPPSGLSKRRGTFRGPPPSFYRSGGWGAHGAKRHAAHEESTGGAGGAGSNSSSANRNDGAWATGADTGGMGPGQRPFGNRQDDVPLHFDREGHERTGRRTEAQQAASRKMRMGGGPKTDFPEPEKGPLGMVFIISGILLMSFLGPVAVNRIFTNAGGGERKRDWNKQTRG